MFCTKKIFSVSIHMTENTIDSSQSNLMLNLLRLLPYFIVLPSVINLLHNIAGHSISKRYKNGERPQANQWISCKFMGRTSSEGRLQTEESNQLRHDIHHNELPRRDTLRQPTRRASLQANEHFKSFRQHQVQVG